MIPPHPTKRVQGSYRRRYGIRRLARCGSVLREDFSAHSDVDVLVEFAPGRTPGLLGLAAMELELSQFVGEHDVELRMYEDLSRHFRDQVRDSAVPSLPQLDAEELHPVGGGDAE